MQKALSMGTALQLLVYGNDLNKLNKHKEAYDIFKINFQKFPQDKYAFLGMIMGNYFMDNKKEAIKYAQKGMEQVSDPNWKNYYKSLVNDINDGKKLFK
jgi:hypothetical protein